MSKRISTGWWWAATLPALAVMLAASSSVIVHGYRPLSVHNVVASGFNEPASFNFEYRVDEEKVKHAATVQLTQLDAGYREEFNAAYAAKNLMDPPTLAGETEVVKATVAWQADPETPLGSCTVALRDTSRLEHPARLAVSPQDVPGELPAAVPSLCEPEGATGPGGVDLLELDANILPEPSTRPGNWEMSYYFVVNSGFEPEDLVISWGAPHEVRLSARA